MKKIILSIVLIVGLATIIIFALNFDTTKIRIFILETKCNNRDAESCFDLGNLYYDGKGVERDYKKAMEFYGKSCEMGGARGCYNRGVLYYNGEGVKQDYGEAYYFYSEACIMRDAWGCYNIGVLYYNGEGVKQDYKKAMEYFGIACDLGKQKGCDAYKKMKLNP